MSQATNPATDEGETESVSESVDESKEAVGEVPMAGRRAEMRRELQTPVVLDGLVTFIGKKAGSWKGLKDRVVARRLNRIRVGERCR